MADLPCPCCGQPTSHPGVLANERVSLAGRRWETQQRIARLRGQTTKNAEAELSRAQKELATLNAALAALEPDDG